MCVFFVPATDACRLTRCGCPISLPPPRRRPPEIASERGRRRSALRTPSWRSPTIPPTGPFKRWRAKFRCQCYKNFSLPSWGVTCLHRPAPTTAMKSFVTLATAGRCGGGNQKKHWRRKSGGRSKPFSGAVRPQGAAPGTSSHQPGRRI
jgi:hypothetical protein